MDARRLPLLLVGGGALAAIWASARRAAAPSGFPSVLDSPPGGALLMYPQVRAELLPFLASDEGEGFTNWLYLDAKGNVTIGIGNLLRTLADALALSWVRPGTPQVAATPADVAGAWTTVAARQDLAGAGAGAFADLRGNEIRASRSSLDALLSADIFTSEQILCRDFLNYGRAPADAQLGLWRLAWAMGPAFAHDPTGKDPHRWPLFRAAFNAGNWLEAGRQSRMSEIGQPAAFAHGNDLVQMMFRNAQWVADRGLPLSVLHYPADLDPLPTSGKVGA